ncbi:hypothetical protein niasHT_040034 [Heterodera trifolii]|uniref:Uncharacterized protein n=1 Tax=Heterodera trifolii TaxID=157864 RepID=A0ABD2J2B3_9BILA
MCANFLITCRAASSSSSLLAHRRRRRPHLLLLIVVVLSAVVVDVTHGMGCMSSKEASLPDIKHGDAGWRGCVNFCLTSNNKQDKCRSKKNISTEIEEGKICRCKSEEDGRCVPFSMDDVPGTALHNLPTSGY